MSTKLDERQLKELKECFSIFDADKSGCISASEFKNVLKALDIKVTENELKNLIKSIDTDGSGQIDFKEFTAVMAQQFYKKPSKKDLEEAFHYFDTDHSGFITEEELFMVMSRFKSGISKQEVTKMIKSIDKNNDGKVSIDEFIALMQQ